MKTKEERLEIKEAKKENKKRLHEALDVFLNFKHYDFICIPADSELGETVILWHNDKKNCRPLAIVGEIYGDNEPMFKYNYSSIKEITYTKPTLFKAGSFNLVLKDGSVYYSASFKNKATIKAIDKFNQKLELCNKYDINQYEDLFNKEDN